MKFGHFRLTTSEVFYNLILKVKNLKLENSIIRIYCAVENLINNNLARINY
jgi:hypothetical protein